MLEGNQGTDDERWNEFVREFERGRGAHEPGAAERETGSERKAGPARRPGPERPRRRGRMTVIAGAGAVAVLAGAAVWLSAGHGTRHQAAPEAAGRAPTTPSARPAASGQAQGSAEPSTAPMVMLTADQAFPAHVAGYTRVGQSGGPNCTSGIGPNLASLIGRSKGCRGVIGALYKDASNNQFTIVAFGMKDQVDVVHLITDLASAPTDYEVPVLTPPAGSGLRTLPPDSAIVQSFAGHAELMVIGLGQWSDGRGADLQALSHKLQPLMDKVTRVAGGRDRG
ncbi:hypothetical protein [Streptomyces broussonetiae]|uniref:Uncharacterized protein n=1 Tax=Streptomyces broussonetiae TaxID=2686304 RepID=A0A6I6N5X6_9ACTN|nr:hypothetical protein [Streptomyces broussonetiae]QHA04285.1 hypothetical protein GQF42_14205 [Streptomyces broussonetiae]